MTEVRQEYDMVPVALITEHPRNPRRGDVEAIDKSIEANGWYGAITVQKSTGFILAGNHRYRAAVERGMTEVPVVLVDVDDETATRILLADNRTADLGTYDEELLGELLAGLESLEGTGFDHELAAAEQMAEEGPKEASEPPDEEEVPPDKYVAAWAVLIECDSEEEQRQTYEELAGAYADRMRVVTV